MATDSRTNYSTLLNQDRKRILVTSGAGFLGSHLCKHLLKDGHDVLCIDNFFTGTKRNIEHLIGNPRFELMRHDVTFPLYVEVDEIYNIQLKDEGGTFQFIVQAVKPSRISINSSERA